LKHSNLDSVKIRRTDWSENDWSLSFEIFSFSLYNLQRI